MSAWDVLTAPCPTPKIRWFARSPRRGNLGGMVTTEAEMLNIARLSHQDFNVYVTLNPTNDRICSRISTEDVTHWAFILIDLDPLRDKLNPVLCTQQMKAKLKLLDPRLDYPAVVWSGRGVQLWLRLPPRSVPDEVSRHKATSATRGFLKHLQKEAPDGWRIDLVGDLARVARMPGSINQKTGEKAQLIDSGMMLQQEVVDWLGENFHDNTLAPQTSIFNGERTLSYMDVADEISLRAKLFIEMGAVEGNRHESCFAACKSLWECGVSKENAHEALMSGAATSLPYLPDRDVRSILEQVYRSV